MSKVEKGLSAASMVTRWREGSPDLVGTGKDVVTAFLKEIREALEGQEKVLCGSGMAILLFKKVI